MQEYLEGLLFPGEAIDWQELPPYPWPLPQEGEVMRVLALMGHPTHKAGEPPQALMDLPVVKIEAPLDGSEDFMFVYFGPWGSDWGAVVLWSRAASRIQRSSALPLKYILNRSLPDRETPL